MRPSMPPSWPEIRNRLLIMATLSLSPAYFLLPNTAMVFRLSLKENAIGFKVLLVLRRVHIHGDHRFLSKCILQEVWALWMILAVKLDLDSYQGWLQAK